MPSSKSKKKSNMQKDGPSHPPVLLCDIEIEEDEVVQNIIKNMGARRRKLLNDPCNAGTVMPYLDYIQNEVLAVLLKENVFLTMEFNDMFQTLCELKESILSMDAKEPRWQERNTLMASRMKFLMVQLMDEIYKELFHMDMEMGESDDEMNENINTGLFKKLNT